MNDIQKSEFNQILTVNKIFPTDNSYSWEYIFGLFMGLDPDILERLDY